MKNIKKRVWVLAKLLTYCRKEVTNPWFFEKVSAFLLGFVREIFRAVIDTSESELSSFGYSAKSNPYSKIFYSVSQGSRWVSLTVTKLW